MRERRLWRHRRLTRSAARPCRRKDWESAGQTERDFTVIAGRRHVSRRSPQCLHAVGRTQRIAQRWKERERVLACVRQRRAQCLALGARRQRAVPHEAAHIFERRPLDQLFDRVAANQQSTAFPVDVTQRRLGNDDAIQTTRGRLIHIRAVCNITGHIRAG